MKSRNGVIKCEINGETQILAMKARCGDEKFCGLKALRGTWRGGTKRNERWCARDDNKLIVWNVEIKRNSIKLEQYEMKPGGVMRPVSKTRAIKAAISKRAVGIITALSIQAMRRDGVRIISDDEKNNAIYATK